MRYRKLGRTGFHVSEMGYGAWGIGGTQWLGGDDRESLLALRHAIELGLNFIDTALAYGDGHSEQLVGEVVRQIDHKIYVASKVPPKNQLWPAKPGVGINEVFPYDYVIASTERSLKNLGLDTIDLQQLHVWNPEWIDRDEWKRAFEDIKKSGKAQAVGVSINDHQPDSALELIKTGLIDTVQVIYNIFDQSPEKNLFPLAVERDIGVIARVPLDEGALTGKIDQYTQFAPTDFRAAYFKGDRKKQVAEHVAAIQRDLQITNGTMPEVALRFCLSPAAVSTVIPGMRTRANVDFNCSIPGKGPLPDKVIAILRKHAWVRNFYDD
jgi:aryl-alcohol dehydrogenase-like predicted oxidoreductase